jgi:hypothetical protein
VSDGGGGGGSSGGNGGGGGGGPKPSTDWKEKIGPDEAIKHAELARRFVEMQQRKSKQHGNGRALHRRGVLGLRAELKVRSGLPAHLAHGLFAPSAAAAQPHEVWVRLSNGSADRQPDARPDVRGFSLKVLGVSGDGALGTPAKEQDFAMIQFDVFTFPTSEVFAGVVLAASAGPISLLRHLIKQHGFFGGLREAGRLQKSFAQPFRGFAVEPFFTAAPIACGPYAVKVRLRPAAQATAADEQARKEGWRAAMARHLGAGPLRYELQLQAFVNERDTPIEDPTVRWSEAVAPFVTVADLEIPSQPVEGEKAEAFDKQIENTTFDPWAALAAHRPLGEIMRARKVTYFASQQARGA